MMGELAALITDDPSLIRAEGGDGKRKLQFAGSIDIARFLRGHGAKIDTLNGRP